MGVVSAVLLVVITILCTSPLPNLARGTGYAWLIDLLQALPSESMLSQDVAWVSLTSFPH